MRNLFIFLREQYFYFLFLILELASLILFFNYNDFQGSSLFNVANAFSGSVNNVFNGISEYFTLKKTNRVLIEEMAKLHSRIPEAFYQSDQNVFYKKDTVVRLEYKYISAKVISNSTNKRNNFLMINKGALHGIENHMGVIIGNKLVGQVVGVSPHFSWIMSMLNKDSHVSGKFKKNDQLVNVEWPGGNYRKGQVREIPKHIVMVRGDTIITSGNSNIFPEGLLIGTIDDFSIAPDENFNTGRILFSTDFNSLGYVEVVVDLMRKEKEELKKSFKSE
ncbi:MAG: rod shape-determining protein MreC [Bacteroidales bacterium]|mgnify:CR=1 FL=1|nr:rod shape-determining protein MreC [Bacteroidales bacterium]NCA74851.1 rod shape-determining protein MreC [Alphaproteobacteria bacterium]HNW72703.1 rod shape-determining protein MreC [Bacteroidales bacterium]HPS49239.1 rod shape-determining protein MreC [Bacteroidales bacterium]